MSTRFDAVVIGSGLGGLTAGALLANAGYSVCLMERNTSLGGAASCYKVGGLTIEASLHETADPRDPLEVKHGILMRLGLLDKLTWVPAGNLFTVQGGPVGEPFSLPHSFEAAREALFARFPEARHGLGRVLGQMERLHTLAGRLSNARENRSLGGLLGAMARSSPLVTGWRATLDGIFAAELGSHEAAKFGLAANLPYYSADPRRLWWTFFGVAQGGMIGAGGVYIQGGSRLLSVKLGGVIKRAGGTVLLGTAATAIELDCSGAVAAVHAAGRGEKPSQRIETRLVLANSSPESTAAMLPQDAARGFSAAFAGLAPSTSLFTAHFGLKADPAAFGLTAYSSVHLPGWMKALNDYASAAEVFAGLPAGRLPPFAIANYPAIDARLDDGGPKLVTVVGVDSTANWAGLTKEQEAERRASWLDAILEEMERLYPGFAGAVSDKIFMSAASMARYLSTPCGAVYGFDPVPPAGPIWRGLPRTPRTPVKNLFLASSFGGSGGFSGAMASGADAARLAEAVLVHKS